MDGLRFSERLVLGAMPATAAFLSARLGIPHESLYAILVRLHDQGLADMVPVAPKSHKLYWDRG